MYRQSSAKYRKSTYTTSNNGNVGTPTFNRSASVRSSVRCSNQQSRRHSSIQIQTTTRFNFRQLIALGLIRGCLALCCILCGVVAILLKTYNYKYGHMNISGGLYFITAVFAVISGRTQKKCPLVTHTLFSFFCCSLVHLVCVGMSTYELWCDVGGHCGCVEMVAGNQTTRPGEVPLVVAKCYEKWNAVPLDMVSVFLTTTMFVFNLLGTVVSVKLTQQISKQNRIPDRMMRRTASQRSSGGGSNRSSVRGRQKSAPAVPIALRLLEREGFMKQMEPGTVIENTSSLRWIYNGEEDVNVHNHDKESDV